MNTPAELAGSVLTPSLTGCTVKLPSEPGVYRLYAYVRDNHGGGATASLPILSGPIPKPAK